ncbi:MAG: 4Fe-4S binding protein [Eubacteriales bacterium]|nr:4Fe-4S binding protein [Eubacteriales bacterium]
MKCSMIVFSPTGGTEKAAHIICSALGTETIVFDLSDASLNPAEYCAYQDTIAVIAMPSYGGRVPALAAERMKKIHVNGTPCILLCVYGNRAYEDTLVEMEDLATECGFAVVAAVAAIAEHSIIHEYAAGRPDAVDEKNLEEIAVKISSKLRQKKTNTFNIPGNRPYKKAGGAGLVPKAGSECTACGLCARQCPARAINPKQLKTADSKKCIACMRCVVKCPQHARKVNSAMVSVAALAIKKACSVRKECELYL